MARKKTYWQVWDILKVAHLFGFASQVVDERPVHGNMFGLIPEKLKCQSNKIIIGMNFINAFNPIFRHFKQALTVLKVVILPQIISYEVFPDMDSCFGNGDVLYRIGFLPEV
jgi:hypothetical protein